MANHRVKSFKLLNHLFKVTYPRCINNPDSGMLRGDVDPDQCKIKVSTTEQGNVIPDSMIEHSRWHEQVHLMFHFAGRIDLYEDEMLVDALAGYLAQYEATVKRS